MVGKYWHRARGTGLSRRRFVAGAALGGAGLAAIPLAGCGDGDNKSSGGATAGSTTAPGSASTTVAQTPTEQPRAGGTWQHRMGSIIGVQDPNFSTGTYLPMYLGD